MKKLFFLLPVFCFANLLFAQQEFPKQPVLTDAQKVYGLSKMCTEVKYNYVYYDKLTFDWDSLCMAAIPEVLATKDAFSYVNVLRNLAAKLGDGHTSVSWNNNNLRVSPLPFITLKYGNRIFVNEVYSKALKEKGIVKGAEILKINGKSAYDYGKENIMPYTAASTPQWRDYYSFSSFELTKGLQPDEITIEYKEPDGKVKTLTTNRLTQKWDDQDIRETFHFKVLPSNVGFLRITTFNDNGMNKKFDAIYDEIKSTDALIIDLRNNGGGNSSYADYILRHFTEVPFKSNQWSSPMYIPAHASWNYPKEWYLQAPQLNRPVNKEIYTKPVIVLINAGTFSSAENFCSQFLGMNRGKLVGTATGGSTGNPIYMNLIDDVASIIICTKKDVMPDGSEFVGVGIKPHVEIEETANDFLNNKDVVLEKAIELIRK